MENNNRLFLFSFLLWYLLHCSVAYTQEKTFSYIHYGSEDGLPSSEVYEVLQDKDGFLWFCTDAGVSKFNGYEFENFNTNDGLTDNTVFHLYEDFKGRIWFLTFNSQLCYYENDSIYPYKYNNLIKKVISDGWVRTISIDSTETLFFTGRRYGFGSVSKQGELISLPSVKNDTGKVSFYNYHNELLVYGLKGEGGSRIDSFISPQTNKIINYENSSLARFSIYQKSIAKNQFIFNVGGKTCYYNKGELKIKNTRDGVHQAFVDNKNHLWLAYNNKGILIYNNLDDAFNGCKPINHILHGKNVTSIFKDYDNGLWVAIQNSGVYYFPNINIEVFSIKEDERTNRISTISRDSRSNVYFGTFDRKIYKVSDSSNFSLFKKVINIYKHSISKIDFSFDNKTGKQVLHPDRYLIGADGIHWSIKARDLWVIRGSDTLLSSKDYPKNTKFNTVFETSKNQIFLASLDGLFKYESDQLVKVSNGLPFSSVRVEDIDELKDGTMLVGTKDNGLFFWKNDSVYKIQNEAELTSAILRDIHVDQDENIWISTPSGVNRLIKESNGNYTVQNITDIHGLPSTEVNAITSTGDIIWVATNKGVAKFNKNKIQENNIPPVLYISNININENSVELQPSYELSYNNNYLEIEFYALAYRARGNVLYRYKMEGIDEGWIESFSRKIRYPSLSHGNYTFTIQAANEDGKWSPNQKVHFHINPPFWKTWWFISLNIILILILLLFLFRIREIRKSKKAEQERLLEQQKLLAAKSELKALRAQMNPHFTFNTLSAIQSAVNNSDVIGASKYIVDFAKLIRKVLENSKHSFITLQEEKEMLQLYLKLEQLRFSHKFLFEIIVDEKLELDFLEIPSMVIQPYVENAIIHGLAPKKEKGHLKIQFLKNGDQVLCSIEDNGVGREQAMEIKKRKGITHNSVAMEITKDRIDLYKKELGGDFSIKIIDLKDESNKPLGTRIEIVFPI